MGKPHALVALDLTESRCAVGPSGVVSDVVAPKYVPPFNTPLLKVPDTPFLTLSGTSFNPPCHPSCNPLSHTLFTYTHSTYYAHPYETELKHLKYPDWLVEDPFRTAMNISAVPNPADRPFQFIETEDELESMLEEIIASGAREIAVDVENHSFRSFQGRWPPFGSHLLCAYLHPPPPLHQTPPCI